MLPASASVSAPTDRDALVLDLVGRLAGVDGLRLHVSDGAGGPAADAALAPAAAEQGSPPPGTDQAGADQAAVRLLRMGTHYRTPLTVTADGLASAAAEVARWRSVVARCAEQPSRPVPAGYREAFLYALHDDLGTPAALAALRRLEVDRAVSDGARFETYAWADRVLALELARDVGR